MDNERKNIFSRGDIWAILLLLACLLLGGAIMIYQKSSKKIPPQLLIETVSKPAPARAGVEPASERIPLKVNLNTAPADSLELIPGIGPVFAQRIVEYRQINGLFQSMEDLAGVSGIGPKTLENIKEFITLE